MKHPESNNSNRITALEEYRRNRDKHDDECLAVMKKIQADVHSLAIRVEKKISFAAGMMTVFSVLGGSVGAIVVYGLKKIGVA